MNGSAQSDPFKCMQHFGLRCVLPVKEMCPAVTVRTAECRNTVAADGRGKYALKVLLCCCTDNFSEPDGMWRETRESPPLPRAEPV